MKVICIEITDTDVYIDGERCPFDHKMDKENHEDDLNQKAIVALANKMGYEPVYLFEKIATRLDDILNEDNRTIDREVYKITKGEKI